MSDTHFKRNIQTQIQVLMSKNQTDSQTQILKSDAGSNGNRQTDTDPKVRDIHLNRS